MTKPDIQPSLAKSLYENFKEVRQNRKDEITLDNYLAEAGISLHREAYVEAIHGVMGTPAQAAA